MEGLRQTPALFFFGMQKGEKMRTEVTLNQHDIEDILANRFGVKPERVILSCMTTGLNETDVTCVITLDNPEPPRPAALPHLREKRDAAK